MTSFNLNHQEAAAAGAQGRPGWGESGEKEATGVRNWATGCPPGPTHCALERIPGSGRVCCPPRGRTALQGPPRLPLPLPLPYITTPAGSRLRLHLWAWPTEGRTQVDWGPKFPVSQESQRQGHCTVYHRERNRGTGKGRCCLGLVCRQPPLSVASWEAPSPTLAWRGGSPPALRAQGGRWGTTLLGLRLWGPEHWLGVHRATDSLLYLGRPHPPSINQGH